MRIRTVGHRTILTEQVWPARLLLATLGVGAMAMAWDALRKGLTGVSMAVMLGGFGMLMLLPLGLGQTVVVIDRARRLIVRTQRGLLGEGRRLAFDEIAEVAVITRDTDEGLDYQIMVRPTGAGPDLRFGAFQDRARADEIVATLRGLNSA